MQAAVLYRVRWSESNRTSPSTLRRRSSATASGSGPEAGPGPGGAMGRSSSARAGGSLAMLPLSTRGGRDEPRRMSQLRQDHPSHREAHGALGSRHGEDQHAAEGPGDRPAEHRRRTDLPEAQGPEDFTEAVQALLQDPED